jgi:hypothetical protein
MTTYKSVKYNISGADLTGIPTSAITSGTFADARISESSVTAHVTATDLQPIKSDISALALREATNESSAAFNLPNQFIDTFATDTLGTKTDVVVANGQVSSGVDIVESGGTTVNIGALSGWNWQGSNFGHDNAQRFYYNTTNGNHTAFTDSTQPLVGNYKMTWKSGTNNNSGVSNTTNASIQFGIGMGTQSSMNYGQSLYNTNQSDFFYVAHNGAVASGNQTLKFYRQQTSQADTSIAFDTNYVLQLIRTGGTLKLYGHASNADPYTVSGTLLHTFSGYSGSQDDDIIIGVGYPSSNTTNSGTDIVNNATITHGITTFAGGSNVNATGTAIQNTNTVGSAKTKVGGTMLYKDNAGTATLGTDLKIYFTCNGGTNWTEASSYSAITPVYSTGIKQVRLGETTCTSGTDIRYKAVWANQASGSKETQLHGIGVNY